MTSRPASSFSECVRPEGGGVCQSPNEGQMEEGAAGY